MRRHPSTRAITLIELMVVMILVAVIMGGVVVGTGALTNSRVRSASTLIISGIRVAYVRSSATSKSLRLVLDVEQSTILLEEADRPMLVRRDDVTTSGGAKAATPQEQQAVDEAEKIIKGPRPPRPSFRPVKALGFETDNPAAGRSLGNGVKLTRVEVEHSKEPVVWGRSSSSDDKPKPTRAYLYFWPGGTTERAAIQIGKGDPPETMLTVLVFPLTGKTKIVSGAQSIEQDRPDTSEREDRGF